MKKNHKKLSLYRDTLRNLDEDQQLGRVLGGDPPASAYCTYYTTICKGSCDCAIV